MPAHPTQDDTAPEPVADRLTWSSAYEVGVAEIDAQHQELFRRAGAFIQSLEKPSRQQTGILLSYLRLYAVTHFGAEEDWMREVAYPGLAEHKRQHDGFIKDLLRLSDQHEAEPAGIKPDRVSGWLERWLKHHVTGTDTDLARYLVRAGKPMPKREEPMR